MVVDDDHFRAGGVGRGDGGLCGGAAVDGEDEARAIFDKAGKRLGARAVAFRQPIGNIGRGRLPMRAKKALDQSDRSRTVDIIVAEHGDRLSCPDGGCKALGRLLHVLQACRIRQQRLERRIEKAGDRLRIGAARSQHTAEQLRQAMCLGDGGGDMRAAGIQPLGPTETARRAVHAEQRGESLVFRRSEFEGCRHTMLAPKQRV